MRVEIDNTIDFDEFDVAEVDQGTESIPNVEFSLSFCRYLALASYKLRIKYVMQTPTERGEITSSIQKTN